MYAMTNRIDNNYSYHPWVRMTKAIMPISDIFKIEKLLIRNMSYGIYVGTYNISHMIW
jgi:hypothetical protein